MKRNKLRLLTLVLSSAPILLLLLATGRAELLQGLDKMPAVIKSAHSFALWFIPLVLLPSIIGLVILVKKTREEMPAHSKLIVHGVFAGLVATFVLDTFRQLGVIHGWLPMDTVMLFGKMIMGVGAQELSWVTAGLLYHFLNGATFGVMYVMLFKKRTWKTGLLWGLIVEFFMMVLPPMAPMVGLFGKNTGTPALFLITLLAHVGFGLTLGLYFQMLNKRTYDQKA